MNKNKIQKARSLIQKSISIDENEKNTLIKLLPIMKEKDIDSLIETFSLEEAVLNNLPSINDRLKENLANIFQTNASGFGKFQQNEIQNFEKKSQSQDLNNIENLIDSL